MTVPTDPTRDFRIDSSGYHGQWLAFWAPLFQLTHFGLGWTRTDVGLSQWMALGRPTDDPVLALIERWWGPHLADYVSEDRAPAAMANVLHDFGPTTYSRALPAQSPAGRGWPGGPSQGLWPDGDSMHSSGHFQMALRDEDYVSPPSGVVARPIRIFRNGDRAALLQDRYAAWYKNLWSLNDVARTASGSSLRVDVVCSTVGWLGEFRRSTVTGAWFRGQHRYHTLGA